MTQNAVNRLSNVPYFLYNVAGLTLFVYGFQGVLGRTLPKELAQAGHYQFLTNLSLLVTIATVVSNIMAIPFNSNRANFISYINLNLNAISLVLETMVTGIYWSLKIFVTHMIVPASVPKENYIPLFLDLSIHFFPVLFLSTDYYLIKKTSFKLPLLHSALLVTSATTTYWFILEALVLPGNSYPYPFLNVEKNQRIVIFVAVSILGLIAYQTYEVLHAIVQSLIYEFEEEKVEQDIKKAK